MTLLELLKRISPLQKIDLFDYDCTVLATDCTRTEIIDILLLKHEKDYRRIINSDIQSICLYTKSNVSILDIDLKQSL